MRTLRNLEMKCLDIIFVFFIFKATTTGSPECQQDPSGATYREEVSHTVSGRTCQKWTVQVPHEHNRTPEEYPNSGLGDHNYCRNVGASSFTAWCYTTDSDKRWEYCPVGTYEPECMAHTTLSEFQKSQIYYSL